MSEMSIEDLEKIGISPKYHKSLIRISWDKYFIKILDLIRQRSHDAETQHGILAVRNNQIIGSGYNGFPPGANDDILPNLRLDDAKYWIISHAEESLILNAAKNGISLNGCEAYISGMPCYNCARKLISVGINKWMVGPVDHKKTETDVLRTKYLVEYFKVQIRNFTSFC